MDKYSEEYLFAEELVNSITRDINPFWRDRNAYRIIGTVRRYTENIDQVLLFLKRRHTSLLSQACVNESSHELRQFLDPLILFYREHGFDPFQFLHCCSFVASYCGHFPCRVSGDAQECAVSSIADLIIYFEETLQFFGHSWIELDKVAKDYMDLEESKKISKLHDSILYNYVELMFPDEVV